MAKLSALAGSVVSAGAGFGWPAGPTLWIFAPRNLALLGLGKEKSHREMWVWGARLRFVFSKLP